MKLQRTVFALSTAITFILTAVSFTYDSSMGTAPFGKAPNSPATVVDNPGMVTCIDFENIPVGTTFGFPYGDAPGDILFSDNGVDVRMRNFYNQSGTPLFGDGIITVNPPLAGMIQQYPAVSQMGLEFDFTNVGVADKIVFTINVSSPIINFSVNGGDLVSYGSLSNIPNSLAPNVNYNYNSTSRTVTLSGEIQKFVIGGASFGVDNICYTLYDCIYLNSQVEILPCVGDNFFVELDLEYFTSSDLFTVFPTGLPQSAHFYDDLPIVLGPFPGDGQNVFEITIQDALYSDCTIQTDAFGEVDCTCPIEGIEAYNIECISEDTYNFNINLKNNGSTASTFNLFLNGSLYGIYPFSSVPLSIQNYVTGASTLSIEVCENKVGGCCNEGLATLPSCSCVIENVQTEVVSCSDGSFYAYLTYNWDMAGPDGFQLKVNNEFYGVFPYTGSIYVGPFPADNTTAYQFTLTDMVNEQCSAEATLGPVTCDEICQIESIITNRLTCDSTGVYGFLLDLETSNVSDSFQLYINGDLYGVYEYSALPLEIGDFKDTIVVTVCDYGNLLCCQTDTLDFSDCTCDIYNLDVELSACDSNGIFSVTLDFGYANTSSSFVIQDQGGQLFGLYNYNELPVTFGSYEGDGITNYQFQVVDPIYQGCSANYVIGQVDCAEGCQLNRAFLSEILCDGSNLFSATLDLETNSNVSDSFRVEGTTSVYGTFSYGDLPVILNQIPEGNEVFTITDNADSTCQLMTLVSFRGCNCSMDQLTLEAGPCEPTDSFYIYVDLVSTNTSDSFNLFIDSVFTGTYRFFDLPIETGPFPGDSTSTFLFEIVDQNNPDCTISGESEVVDCMADNCDLTQATVLEVNCNPDGTYAVLFDLDHMTSSDSFVVFYGSSAAFSYAYADLPVLSPPLTGSLILEICDQSIPGCCTDLPVDDSNCSCTLSDLTVSLQGCEIPTGADYGIFTILVDVDGAFVSDSFIAEVNGQVLGLFPYSSLPLELGPFDGDGVSTYVLTITDAEDPNCSFSQDFGPVDCLADCGFINLEVLEFICNADGSYDIIFNFEPVNVQGAGVEVTLDGQLYQFFPYTSAPPILIEGYIPDDDFLGVILCDNDNPGCCAGEVYFPLPGCEPCKINSPEILVSDCSPDGSFSIDLNFDYLNTTDSFNLSINGVIYDTYAYQDLPIAAGPFEGDAVTNRYFFIEDQVKTGCASDTLLGPVDCLPDCMLSDLVMADLTCNSDGSSFSGVLNLNAANASDSLVLFQGSTAIGSFAYADLPIEVDGLIGASGQTVLFSACDQNEPNCCSNLYATSFPDCPISGDCSIENFTAIGFCDGTNGFLQLTFDAEFTSDSFVVESCFELGTFAYAQGFFILEVTPAIEACAIGNILPLVMYDQADPANCQAFELALLPDCAVVPDCEITDVTLEATDCADGFFDIILDFTYSNVSDSFLVVGNGNLYGIYSYNELPLNIGSFPGDNATTYEFGVIDLGDIGCNAYQSIGPVNCLTCNLSNLTYDFECEGPNTIVNFDFDHEGTSDSFSVLSCSGSLLGTFAYTDSPFSVTVPASFAGCFGGGTTIPFVIRDQMNGNECFLFNFIDLPDCANACSIYDVVAEITDCTNDAFTVLLDFETNMTGTLGYIVFVQGDLFGPFDYSTAPLELGPFTADGGQYDFLVVDLEDPFCYGYVDLGSVTCPTCDLEDLEVALECNPDGSFLAVLNVTHNYPATDSFSVSLNDTMLGTYLFDELPLTIDGLNSTNPELTWLLCLSQTSSCCDTLVVPSPQCLINCLEDEVLDPEVFTSDDFQEGDTLFFIQDVTGTLADPFYFDWQTSGGKVAMTTDGFVKLTNAALEFDLQALGEKERLVIMDVSADSAYWLSVNGKPVLPFGIPDDTLIFEGNTRLQVVQSQAGQTIQLEGEVNSVGFGSVAASISSMCYVLVDDQVWPGDVNHDRIANYIDLLYYGLEHGFQGIQRQDETILWEGQPAEDWGIQFVDGTDIKHADCDGNGLVEFADIKAIKENYNLTHGIPNEELATIGDSLDPPIFFDFSDLGNLVPGQSVVLPLVLGTQSKPIEEIHGLAIRLQYSPQALSSFSHEVVPGWFGLANEFTHLMYHDPASGIMELAITRLNQVNAAGHGQIAKFIGIIDDLAGLQIPDITITNVAALDRDENPVWINIAAPGEYPEDDKKDNTPQGTGLQVYPNPSTGGEILVIKESTEAAQGIRISNIQGDVIYRFDGDFRSKMVDGSTWNPGVYFIQVPLETTVLTRKLFIVRP